MATRITPSLSASAPFLQGISVSTYSIFYQGIRPRLGRSNKNNIFLSSSTGGIINRNPYETNFFDDSIGSYGYPNVGGPFIFGGEAYAPTSSVKFYAPNSSVIVPQESCMDNDYRIIEEPNYVLNHQTFGIQPDFKGGRPYVDSDVYSASFYLQQQEYSMMWPVVLDNEAAEDAAFSYNGVIEPLTIRKYIAGTSTYIGNHFDPEPYSVKGTMHSGEFFETRFRRSVPGSNWFEPTGSVGIAPFADIDAALILREMAQYLSHSIAITDDAFIEATPWNDTTSPREMFKEVRDKPIRNFLISSSVSASFDYRPSENAKSAGTGFTYDNALFGLDSIAFGGIKK